MCCPTKRIVPTYTWNIRIRRTYIHIFTHIDIVHICNLAKRMFATSIVTHYKTANSSVLLCSTATDRVPSRWSDKLLAYAYEWPAAVTPFSSIKSIYRALNGSFYQIQGISYSWRGYHIFQICNWFDIEWKKNYIHFSQSFFGIHFVCFFFSLCVCQ